MSVQQKLGRDGLREPLGDVLVRQGRVTRHGVEQAVEEASQAGVRLGEHLVGKGLISEKDVAVALSEQFGLPYVVVHIRDINPALVSLIPAVLAQRLRVLPLSASDDCIRIAVEDPTDVVMTDELRMVVDRPLQLVVADASSITRGLRQLYAAVPSGRRHEEARQREPVEQRSTAIDAGDSESPAAVEIVNELLRQAIAARASDLHLIPRRESILVRARVDGVMRDLRVVSAEDQPAVVARLKVMAHLDIAERRLPQDGRVAIRLAGAHTDLRIAVLPTTFGESVVIRIAYIADGAAERLETLGLDTRTSGALDRALGSSGGAIIVAGPTGSGKTTTLYAAVNKLHDGSRSIITIEDPVERVIEGLVQIEVNPRAGLTFAKGLRTILRADPDVILIGEIRDNETAAIAMQAAMTGHLVLTTLHAENAPAALIRLRELGVPARTLAASTRLVISQRLIRAVCQVCKGEQASARSCAACDSNGYRGRLGIYESIEIDDATRHVLATDSADLSSFDDHDQRRTFVDHAAELVARGLTTRQEMDRVCGPSAEQRPPKTSSEN